MKPQLLSIIDTSRCISVGHLYLNFGSSRLFRFLRYTYTERRLAQIPSQSAPGSLESCSLIRTIMMFSTARANFPDCPEYCIAGDWMTPQETNSKQDKTGKNNCAAWCLTWFWANPFAFGYVNYLILKEC
jgi:hypothetical protein